jgi:multidrug efflux pump subunit AcrA (membrane-fusion protein)
VATLAADRKVDAVIEVPEKILSLLEKGADVPVAVGGKQRSGRFDTVIPKGDIASRTFSVKIGLVNDGGLLEGMEARATLPTGEKIDGFLVSRDAVVNQFGRNVIFVAVEGAAKMVPIQVLGYYGLMVGVAGPGLSAGMNVVVKGNERLRNGQPLMVQQQKSE